MRCIIAVAFFSLVLSHEAARAEFTGKLVLDPPGCEKSGECTLGEDFAFKDPSGIGWKADKGNKTDGASIPAWAQPIVGEAFTESYVKAAVIHDHYCDRHVRPWRQTHRVFFDSLIASNVSVPKAKLLYFAVYLGGPKWVELIKGKPCKIGEMCINSENVSVMVPDSTQVAGEDEKSYFVRGSTYDARDFAADLNEAERLIAEGKDTVTLEVLEVLAEKKKPDDFYFRNGAEVKVTTDLQFQ